MWLISSGLPVQWLSTNVTPQPVYLSEPLIDCDGTIPSVVFLNLPHS